MGCIGAGAMDNAERKACYMARRNDRPIARGTTLRWHCASSAIATSAGERLRPRAHLHLLQGPLPEQLEENREMVSRLPSKASKAETVRVGEKTPDRSEYSTEAENMCPLWR